ncbi:hypothetical protein CWS35_10695 [Bradyrhizobium sp. SK17]|nr:hypothetical protein CWS35_10695 [Bradyrhizobium sp. SK17]
MRHPTFMRAIELNSNAGKKRAAHVSSGDGVNDCVVAPTPAPNCIIVGHRIAFTRGDPSNRRGVATANRITGRAMPTQHA